MKILARFILSIIGLSITGGLSYVMWLAGQAWWAGLAVIALTCLVVVALIWSGKQLTR